MKIELSEDDLMKDNKSTMKQELTSSVQSCTIISEPGAEPKLSSMINTFIHK